jgi:anti-sigma B factor antagonist
MTATHGIASAPFGIDVHPERDIVRVCPSGDVDLATAGAIRRQIDELTSAGFRRIVLDLGGVTFLDSTGIRLVIDLATRARTEGWALAIVEGSPDVQQVFRITGLLERLPFVPAADVHNPWTWA